VGIFVNKAPPKGRAPADKKIRPGRATNPLTRLMR